LPGDAAQKLTAVPNLKEIVITDTVPLADSKRHPKITVLSIAPLLGEAIRRIHEGRSVGELFT
jgi:ribose-phosphate pyrophosphokinase